MIFIIVLFLGSCNCLTFTGNAEIDFPASQNVENKNFAMQKYEILIVPDQADVGTPPNWKFKTPDGAATSGWDIKDIRFQYDYVNDAFHMAINCFGICGDADADGDPSRTSSDLQMRGGTDLPSFAQSESCAIALDFGVVDSDPQPDNNFDFVIGYASGKSATSERFPCSVGKPTEVFDVSCFGLYLFDADFNTFGDAFIYNAADPTLALVRSKNLAIDHNAATTLAKPDLEWTLNNFNDVRASARFAPVDRSGATPFAIGVAAYCGSFQDDGIGEDSVPNGGGAFILEFACQLASDALCKTTTTLDITPKTTPTATGTISTNSDNNTTTSNSMTLTQTTTTTTTTTTAITTATNSDNVLNSDASLIYFHASLLLMVVLFL